METSSFIFFESYFDALQYLQDKDFGAMVRVICEYALKGEEPQITSTVLKSYWTLIRPTLDRSIKRAEAGRVGGKSGVGVSRNIGNANAANKSKTIANQNIINTDKDKEREKEMDREIGKRKDKAIAYPYDAVVALWNELCMPLPQVKKLNDSRRKKIKCRLVEFSKDSNEWLPKTKELFERVMSSDFLRGEKSDWQATFDWLFDNPKNWVKVMEGNYDNERKYTSTQQQVCPNLGVGEFIAQDGTRRYGTGNLPAVPFDAPPRPDDDCYFSAETKTWIPSGV